MIYFNNFLSLTSQWIITFLPRFKNLDPALDVLYGGEEVKITITFNIKQTSHLKGVKGLDTFS